MIKWVFHPDYFKAQLIPFILIVLAIIIMIVLIVFFVKKELKNNVGKRDVK